jgi:hypothetical protein
METNTTSKSLKNKQRVTVFIEPILLKRARVRGALEGFTISEIVERALDCYAPKIEKNNGKHIKLEFADNPEIDRTAPKRNLKSSK